ncbi:hypothetical protein BJ742DRAFT_831456 [Cladochytrium replicatum]|nr:hypothetical protein BJ742DRAFT_831456 [Cladochytrium replicatum]
MAPVEEQQQTASAQTTTVTAPSTSTTSHEEIYEHHEEHKNRRVIAIAIDASKHSDYCFQYAMDNIVTKDDQVCLLNVRPLSQLMSPFTSPYADISDWVEKLEAEAKEDSHRLLKSYGSRVLKRRIACRASALRGDPRDELVAKVNELKATCLIIGSRGMGQFKRAMLGSVSDYCIHHANCPVLVVRERSA